MAANNWCPNLVALSCSTFFAVENTRSWKQHKGCNQIEKWWGLHMYIYYLR
eukprot:COSAG02_NODE_3135_length_7303_cov_11.100222_5_plen_51_part_00